MSQIILQPTSNKDAMRHFESTIVQAVGLDVIREFVTDNRIISEIENEYINSNIYIWGVTNGKNNVNKKKWEKITKGDVTLFSKTGGIFAKAVTTMKFNNYDLAKNLWGVDENNNTWENIYLVTDIEMIDVTYKRFNKILGYKDNYVIQGLQVLDEIKSNKLFEVLELYNYSLNEPVSIDDYKNTLSNLENADKLDTEYMARRRKEQSFLRNYLFGNDKYFECGICGEKFPIDMLITAHIKKRSYCSNDEKLDYKNIVMPMCKLGCDDLYEKGYIFVDGSGKISLNRDRPITQKISQYVDPIIGKRCKYYNEQRSKYFKANVDRHKIGV